MAVILTAAGTPVAPHRSTVPKPRNPLPAPRLLILQRNLRRALVALSSALAFAHGGGASALTYEEALSQSVGSGDAVPDVGFDVAAAVGGLLRFAAENPVAIGGAAAALAVPLVLSRLLGGAKPYGVVLAKDAYARMSEEPGAQLLDIRAAKDVREVGAPDVRAAGKKAVQVAYSGEDKNGFLKRLGLRFKDPENTTLLILDKDDGNSELVAELVTANDFKAAFAIKDGVEGRRGWLNSNLPWTPPKKGFSFNLGDWVASTFGDNSADGLPLTLGLAAATGLGVFAFTEIETLLQLLGSAAVIQIVTKKLLFAEDRKVTLGQVDEFLNTKVAPKELVDEIKVIGQALLPSSGGAKSLPAPTEALSAAATSSTPAVEAAPVHEAETAAAVEAEATTEAPAAVKSAPVAEFSAESLPGRPRPLSPYPNYPDLKPPSSPSPSAP